MSFHSSRFPFNGLGNRARFAATIAGLAVVSACTSDRPDIAAPNSRVVASRGGVPAQGLASPIWQKTARDLVSAAKFNPQAAGRAYALLGVAQYLAVQRAEAEKADGTDGSSEGVGSGGRPRLEMTRGAVAGASAVVLGYLFPDQVQTLEQMVTDRANSDPGQLGVAFAAGEAIGREAGAEMVVHGTVDGFSAPNTAVAPLGPGFWTSSTIPPSPPVGGQLPGMTRWFLTSANQFRPGPPPTFRSAEFTAALREIRLISDNRSQLQTDIATFWALNPGTPTPPGFWLDQASQEIVARNLSEREATHVFALVSTSVADALIGCWDAKLTYWFIRPWNADQGITTVTAVGKPNHPSYPSGHSCVSAAAAEVLSTFFPERRADFTALAAQAGLSRIYAGIHYRFDVETGLDLGRKVALFAIATDASGTSVLSR
jgi:hypothetical protein